MALAAASVVSLSSAYAEGPLDYPEASQAATAGKTREQVRQELATAIQNGEIISGNRGETLAEQYPGRYPKAETAGKTREQVKKELADAVQSGQIVTGRHGKTLAERYPNRYAGKSGSSEQVGQSQ